MTPIWSKLLAKRLFNGKVFNKNCSHTLSFQVQCCCSLQATPRPITLRFVDVGAGVVTRHEIQTLLQKDGDTLSAAIAQQPPGAQQSSPRRQLSASTNLTKDSTYKIILLGTAGVGKSSLLAVATHGDDAYTVLR